MKDKVIVLVIIKFLFISCVDLHKDKNYKKYIQYFEQQQKGSTSHFPREYKSVINDYSYNIDTTAYFNTLSFNITITDKLEIEKLNKVFLNEKRYDIDDSCIIVLNDFIKPDDIPFIPSDEVLLSENMDKKYTTTFFNNCHYYKVIPNFWSSTEGIEKNSRNNLNHNFKYIILDNNMGKEVYSNKLNSNISYMPDFARHGYSKGIAFNDKENLIIYWLIFW